MADIVIRGMEMPISCIACPLNYGEKRPEYGLTIYCPYSDGVISWRDKIFDNGRFPSCGIISLPEGHGRCIDADAFCKYIANDKRIDSIIAAGIISYIEHASTIVPAEGENADGN